MCLYHQYDKSFFSTCDTINQTFDIAGIVDVILPPTTGQLVVKNCSGDSVIITPPFNSPISFTISGINADGTQNCTLTAYFTDDPSCSIVSFPFLEPNCLLPCQFIDVTTSMDSCTNFWSSLQWFNHLPESNLLQVNLLFRIVMEINKFLILPSFLLHHMKYMMLFLMEFLVK